MNLLSDTEVVITCHSMSEEGRKSGVSTQSCTLLEVLSIKVHFKKIVN